MTRVRNLLALGLVTLVGLRLLVSLLAPLLPLLVALLVVATVLVIVLG